MLNKRIPNRLKTIYALLGMLGGFYLLSIFTNQIQVSDSIRRESALGIIEQIQLIGSESSKLEDELGSLKSELNDLENTYNSSQSINKKIDTYQHLLLDKSSQGEGITLVLDTYLEASWIIDIINDLYLSGAELISINRYPLKNNTGIIEKNGLIYMGEKQLQIPFIFKVIGDSEDLFDSLTGDKTFIYRLRQRFPDVTQYITIEKTEVIVIGSTNN